MSNETIRPNTSSYDPQKDENRLLVQSNTFLDLDTKAISKSISYIRKNKSSTIKILDVGCAFGYVTYSRFVKFEKVEVLGIDKNENSIKLATERYETDQIKFSVGDIEDKNYFPGMFDLIFCGFVLHHLENSEEALKKLWTLLNSNGVLVVRTFDEGLKIDHPPNKDMQFLLSTFRSIRRSSDRYHGRKLYSHIRSLEPKPVKTEMIFEIYSTVGMTKKQRLDYFQWVFSFRADPAFAEAKKPNASPEVKALAEKLDYIIKEQRKRFVNDPAIFSATNCIIGLSYKE